MPLPADESELRGRLIEIVRAAGPLMEVLETARILALPDHLLFSGAVYQPVLNHLTGRPPDYGIKDYDLGYFDAADLSYEAEDAVIRRVAAAFDEPLRSRVEVRNQARVHLWFEAHFGEPYARRCSRVAPMRRGVSRRRSPRSACGWSRMARSVSKRPLASPIYSRCACVPIRDGRRRTSLGPSTVSAGAGLS